MRLYSSLSIIGPILATERVETPRLLTEDLFCNEGDAREVGRIINGENALVNKWPFIGNNYCCKLYEVSTMFE